MYALKHISLKNVLLTIKESIWRHFGLSNSAKETPIESEEFIPFRNALLTIKTLIESEEFIPLFMISSFFGLVLIWIVTIRMESRNTKKLQKKYRKAKKIQKPLRIAFQLTNQDKLEDKTEVYKEGKEIEYEEKSVIVAPKLEVIGDVGEQRSENMFTIDTSVAKLTEIPEVSTKPIVKPLIKKKIPKSCLPRVDPIEYRNKRMKKSSLDSNFAFGSRLSTPRWKDFSGDGSKRSLHSQMSVDITSSRGSLLSTGTTLISEQKCQKIGEKKRKSEAKLNQDSSSSSSQHSSHK